MRPTFRKICNNDPAIAIKALIDSLSNQDHIPWLNLDFSSFQESKEGICFGCGATYTVIALVSSKSTIASINSRIFSDDKKYADRLGCDINDLQEFEEAIDDFRRCAVDLLAAYFDTKLPQPQEYWCLSNRKGLGDIPIIQKYYDKLIANRATV